MKQTDQRGLTLIEMIVALFVLGMMVVAITTALFVGLRTSRESNQRVTDAVGVSFASAYFVPDVESAITVDTADFSDCELPGAVVMFSWIEGDPRPEATPTSRFATYAVQPRGSEFALIRRTCVPSGSQMLTVVRGLVASPLPRIDCTIAGGALDPDCADPHSVSMTLQFESERSVTLSASRRVDDEEPE